MHDHSPRPCIPNTQAAAARPAASVSHDPVRRGHSFPRGRRKAALQTRPTTRARTSIPIEKEEPETENQVERSNLEQLGQSPKPKAFPLGPKT
jgi:hypothetical protein